MRVVAPVVATTPIILSSNNIQNGDVLVPANPVYLENGRYNGDRGEGCSPSVCHPALLELNCTTLVGYQVHQQFIC